MQYKMLYIFFCLWLLIPNILSHIHLLVHEIKLWYANANKPQLQSSMSLEQNTNYYLQLFLKKLLQYSEL
jgi:hypothetical protein